MLAHLAQHPVNYLDKLLLGKRDGGEEFVVLLRNPGPEVALDVGERVRSAVAGLDLARFGVGKVSVSVGVAVSWLGRRADRGPHHPGRPGAVPSQERRPRPGRRRIGPRSIRATVYHRTVTTDQAALTNDELAQLFHQIGDILEVKGELVFKVVAYHRAADAIAGCPVDVAHACLDGRPPRLPGVGKAIADKIEERVRTGRLAYHERLIAEFPPTLVDLLRIPGLGPKTVGQIYRELRIATLEDLRTAAQTGRLRGLRGISARTEEQILAGIAGLEQHVQRLRLNEADDLINLFQVLLAQAPGVHRIVPAGSFRRRRETIGDLDFLAETEDPAALVERFVAVPRVREVIAKGGHKAAIALRDGPNVDLMIMPPGDAGTYLVHFTGSKEHNVRLRARARDIGWSLSEKGFLRIDVDTGQPLAGPDAELRTMATEEEVYDFLGLPFIEPELREDEGEIEAAPRRAPATAGPAGRPARRPAQPLRVVGRERDDRGDGRGRPAARSQLPGPDRSHPVTPDRERSDARSGGSAARDHRRAQRPVRGGGAGGAHP